VDRGKRDRWRNERCTVAKRRNNFGEKERHAYTHREKKIERERERERQRETRARATYRVAALAT
jgi:hypothetical protein